MDEVNPPIGKVAAKKFLRLEFFAPVTQDEKWEAQITGNWSGLHKFVTFQGKTYETVEAKAREYMNGRAF